MAGGRIGGAIGDALGWPVEFLRTNEIKKKYAVNHDGDSDSTGAITGNILGVYLGLSKIPVDLIEKVELKEALMQMADDLLTGYQESSEWQNRYPGY